MSLISTNTWDYNCGSKNDLDYRVIWGIDGELTIQRNYLRSITFSLLCWNSIDGWVERNKTLTLPSPTSNPYTFSGVHHFHAFAKGVTNLNWGKRYKMTGKIVVLHGNQIIVDEKVVTTVNGCFRMNDPYYEEYFSGCIPPDVVCENIS
jgi:hypothetical protein